MTALTPDPANMPDVRLTDEYNPHTCKICDCELEWFECGSCDDGFYEGYDEDPLWYDPGDLVRCGECNGQGGWLECPNAVNHPQYLAAQQPPAAVKDTQ